MSEKISSLDLAAQLLKMGELVAIPTETVYGLAASIYNEAAIKRIFEFKQRPFFDPLIVHVASIEDLSDIVEEIPQVVNFLVRKFWPGPLTMILPKKKSVSDYITAGLDSVGVRNPAHPMTLELIKKVGTPLAAPSANMFQRASPTLAEHVLEEFKNTNLKVLDGGRCEVGVESTVLSCVENQEGINIEVYRPGGVTIEEITNALVTLNKPINIVKRQSKAAPGQLEHHYMPAIPVVVLNDLSQFENVKNHIHDKLKIDPNNFIDLKLNKDPRIAARELYSQLRECTGSGRSYIRVFAKEFPHDGMGDAVLNRLGRAASLNYVKF